jgi:nucleoside-diphosphate-sugar epimerase
MRVFITGASGWIGSAAVAELVSAGHQVVGLGRSPESASTIENMGATAQVGDLDDLDSLRRGASEADAVVHLANKHDWANPAEINRSERAAVQAMLDVLVDTGKAFMVANGMSGLVEGRAALESDASPAVGPTADRGGSENLVLEHSARGVRGLAIRFAPSIHGAGDWGFVTFLTAAARDRGVSGYVGDGAVAWSAAHRSDTARLIRLGLEQAPAGTRLHAVAEQAVPTRVIAEAIGESLGVPVASVDPADADAHFGVVGHFFGRDMSASSEATRALLGWTPTGPSLVDDIRSGAYTAG